MRHVLNAFLIALVCSGCASFTDPLGRKESLELAQKHYTDFVRWGDLERASRFVEPDQRDVFLEKAGDLEQIRVTDFDVMDIEFDGEDEVNVFVTYLGFSLITALEHRFREHQRWLRDPGLGNQWWVETDLIDAIAVLRDES